METVTVSPKFQVVIPLRIREALGIRPGQKLQIMIYDNRIEIIPIKPIRENGEFLGVFDIETLEMIEGDLPQRAERLVREWAHNYQRDLLEMWQSQQFRQLPGLE